MTPTLVAQAGLISPPESSGPNIAKEKFTPGSFHEHLRSAEKKRQHDRAPVKGKPGRPTLSTRSVAEPSRQEPNGSLSAKAAGKTFAPTTRPATKTTPAKGPAEDLPQPQGAPDDAAKVQEHRAISSLLEALCEADAGETLAIEPEPPPSTLTDSTSVTAALGNVSAPAVSILLPDSTAERTEATLSSARQIMAGEFQQPLPPAPAPVAPAAEPARPPNETSSAEAPAEVETAAPESLSGDTLEFSDHEWRVEPREQEPPIAPPALAVSRQETPPPDGTIVAKGTMTMKNTVKMDEVAGPAVKNLPGTERALDLPAAQVVSRVEEARAVRQELRQDAAVMHAAFTATASSGARLAVEDSAPAATIPAVERVTHAVLDGVAHLRQTGNESVSVLLKPEDGTELLLRVEMRDGALSAQLHFQRGDRSALDPHWDELQKRLGEQGVRLSRDEAGFGSSAQFAQSQRRPFVPENDLTARTLVAPGTKLTSVHAINSQRRVRGFETWA